MTEPYVILTDAEIDDAAFAGFLARIGATRAPLHADQGRLSQGRRHVWIYLNPESLDNLEPQAARAVAASEFFCARGPPGKGDPPQS